MGYRGVSTTCRSVRQTNGGIEQASDTAKSERQAVTTDALKGYVDDGRQWGDLMRRGTRFHPKRKRFTWREDWEEEDNRENL
jgi:hypothetical protein